MVVANPCFRSYGEIIRDPLPPVEYDVEPLIARGARVLIYADPGVGKTWLGLDLGLSLAAGRKWVGQFPVPSPRRVLYIDEEMGSYPLERRIHRLGAGAEIADSVPFWVLSRPALVFNEAGVSHVLSACDGQGFNPEVIVVDSLRRVLVGSENDAEAVVAFWRNTAPLYKDRTLVIIHHMKKPSPLGGNDSRYRASGSTDLLAGADVAFAVTRAHGDGMLIECVKSRYGIEPPPFLVSLYDETDDGSIVIRYDGSRADAHAETTAANRAETLIVKYLSDRPDSTASTAEIKNHLSDVGVRDRTAERVLSALRKARRLERPEGKRGCWRLVTKQNHAA